MIEQYGLGVEIVELPDKAVENHHISKHVAVGAEPDEKKIWKMGPVLSQTYGSCVGFGWTAEFIGRPVADVDIQKRVAEAYAMNHWKRAQYLFKGADNFRPDSQDGTSLQSGGEVAVERGLIDEYVWATNVEQIRAAIITTGPVVVATPWVNSMHPNDDYRLPVSKTQIEGRQGQESGHCYSLCGYHPNKKFTIGGVEVKKPAFKMKNSWGKTWGQNGYAWILVEDFEFMFDFEVAPYEGKYFGVASLPVGRNKFDLKELTTNNPDPTVS